MEQSVTVVRKKINHVKNEPVKNLYKNYIFGR